MERAHRVASELLSTEEQYVSILHLIDQVGSYSILSYFWVWIGYDGVKYLAQLLSGCWNTLYSRSLLQ